MSVRRNFGARWEGVAGLRSRNTRGTPPRSQRRNDDALMRIGLSTSVIQRGRTGVAQYVFSLLRALRGLGSAHEFVLFVLEEDIPLFEFARGGMEIVAVPERFRPPVRNVLWH